MSAEDVGPEMSAGENTGDLADFLEASSRLFGTPHGERRALWQARLEMNRPELDRFRELVGIGDDPFFMPTPDRTGIEYPSGAPVLRLASQISSGLKDRRQVLANALDAAERRSGLNAFICLNADAVNEPATDGALSGVPIAVKDLISVKGLVRTGGTKSSDPEEATVDAAVVARLKKAGAVVIGMTNLHELAYGITSANPHFGHVGNPLDGSRIVGGSSGGSAAAVAAGIVPLAIGTDTAGSIRIPAACCGVVGMKPSYDLIPRDGVMPLAWSLDHVGPIAANVADAAAALAAMASSPAAMKAKVPKQQGFRLVRPANFFFELLEPSVKDAVEKALDRLADTGFAIEEHRVEDVEYAAAAQFMTICPEAWQANSERLTARPNDLGEDVRVRLEIGQFLRAGDYILAQRFRTRLRRTMTDVLYGAKADAIVTPTVPIGAPPIGAATVTIEGMDVPVHTAMTRCTAPFNLTGMPAITLPCGRDKHEMPVSIQFAAPFGSDGDLIRLALAAEHALSEQRSY